MFLLVPHFTEKIQSILFSRSIMPTILILTLIFFSYYTQRVYFYLFAFVHILICSYYLPTYLPTYLLLFLSFSLPASVLTLRAADISAIWIPAKKSQRLHYYYYYSLIRAFHISISQWFFTGVWVTASLLKSPGLFLVSRPFSIMLSFGWSPLVRQLLSPLVPLVIL